MVNETRYRYLWVMEKADEETLFNELAALGNERTKQEAKLETLAVQSRDAAKAALRSGMKPSRIAKALRYTDGYVRKLRIEAKLPPDPRYADVTPPKKRHLGFGDIGIGDTLEEAMASAGPIDYGTDLKAAVAGLTRVRVAELVDELRTADPQWYAAVQAQVAGEPPQDMRRAILVLALADGKLGIDGLSKG